MRKAAPNGMDRVIESVHTIDAIKAEIEVLVRGHNQALEKLNAKLAKAEAALSSLVLSGSCVHNTHIKPTANGEPDVVIQIGNQVTAIQLKSVELGDKSIPQIWRLAHYLSEHERLDYQEVARAFWGEIPMKVAKNRISTNLQQLRNMGVATALGENRFQINREVLAKKSGLLEEARP